LTVAAAMPITAVLRNSLQFASKTNVVGFAFSSAQVPPVFLRCSQHAPIGISPGNFIAQWVPTWLIIGLYNKLVKLEGHDRFDRGRDSDSRITPADEANAARSI
jgi:hypothetical protein